MNLIGTRLNSLPRRVKTLLVLLNDLFLAFVCWLVFGPPMATVISDQNSFNLLEVIYILKYARLHFQRFCFFYIYISLDIIDHLLDFLIQEILFFSVFPALYYLDSHGHQFIFFSLI